MSAVVTPDLRFAPPRNRPAGLDMSLNTGLPAPVTREIKVIQHRLRHALWPMSSPLTAFGQTRTIFVRIPKNASNSILAQLYPQVTPAALPHYAAEFYRRVVPRAFRAALVFAPIRHPLERFASAFTYYREVSTTPQERRLMDHDLPFLKTLQDFALWLNDQPDLTRVPVLGWHHFHQQTAYVCAPDGRVITDLMFPVEDMSQGLALLAAHTGQTDTIPHLNPSPPHPLDGLPLDRIAAHYADDMALWDRVHAAGALLTRETTGSGGGRAEKRLCSR
jgi:hypothetical protein